MTRWIELKPESNAGRVGCLFVLAAVLLLIGVGVLAAFVADPAGKGDMWVMPLVGGAFAIVGLILLYAGIRGARGASVPAAEVAKEEGGAFRAGGEIRLRVRQPGPAKLESLKLKAICERIYEDKVKPNSTSTVERHDVVWEQVLLDVSDEEVRPGGALEREVRFALPPNARPSGEAQPKGKIRWKLEVLGEAGFMRATYREYKIWVEPAPEPVTDGGGAATAARAGVPTEWSALFGDKTAHPSQPAPQEHGTPVHRPSPSVPGFGSRRKGDLSFNAGCLLIALPFSLVGAFFLWAFFSGAAFHGHGNPYMALVGGLLFGGVGLLGLGVAAVSLAASRKDRRRRARRT